MDWFEAGCCHAPFSPQLKTRKPENVPFFLNAGANQMWNPHIWLAFLLQMCILFPLRSLSQHLQKRREELSPCVWEADRSALTRYTEARAPHAFRARCLCLVRLLLAEGSCGFCFVSFNAVNSDYSCVCEGNMWSTVSWEMLLVVLLIVESVTLNHCGLLQEFLQKKLF